MDESKKTKQSLWGEDNSTTLQFIIHFCLRIDDCISWIIFPPSMIMGRSDTSIIPFIFVNSPWIMDKLVVLFKSLRYFFWQKERLWHILWYITEKSLCICGFHSLKMFKSSTTWNIVIDLHCCCKILLCESVLTKMLIPPILYVFMLTSLALWGKCPGRMFTLWFYHLILGFVTPKYFNKSSWIQDWNYKWKIPSIG